jgi:N utilization substance protein A
MDSREILLVVDAMSNEKGVGKEVIFEAIEAALAMATRKHHNMVLDSRVEIDRDEGEYETFRQWLIVADDFGATTESEDPLEEVDVFEADLHIHLTDAIAKQADAEVEGYISEPMESAEFGRIAAQTAKQIIVQKVREAERAQVVALYEDKIGEMILGTVKRVERGNVTIDLGGNAEAFIPREEMIPRESVRSGDRIRGYLKEIRADQRGPQLVVSRIHPDLLVELFKLEVPEIADGLIEIKGAARDPGLRAKIAVEAKEDRIDPVGACVGMRGSRVQVVTNELGGERIDIIVWDEDPALFAVNAMAPADVLSIVVDEDSHSMDVAVDEESLSQAIGRGGQNIRLASRLTGWDLNVMSVEDANEKAESEANVHIGAFMEQLDVDEDLALILVQEGFTSLEEIAYVAEEEMLAIEEFDNDMVTELRSRASDILLTRALASEESIEPAQDLLEMEGMTAKLAQKLASKGIATKEDLAEQAVDELMEVDGMEEALAGSLIMKARESWFTED